MTLSKAELDELRRIAREAVEGANTSGPAHDPRGRDFRPSGEDPARDLRLAELERVCKAAVRDRELATALAGKPLVAGAASQLIKLWRDDFDAYEDGGQFKVAARDGRSVADAVSAWLGSPEFSHFCLPTSKGGNGARDASRTAQTAPQPAPRNLGEAVVQRWREESVSRPNGLSRPFGLRRPR